MRAAVALFIADPDRDPDPGAEVFQDLYALTPKQAELAAWLVKGDTLKNAAAKMGISEKTARTHLEQIFRRTATRSQNELLRLLLATRTLGLDTDL